MLDEIAPPHAPLLNVGQQLPYHVELVVARKDLLALLLAGPLVLFLDDLGIVLQDVGQSLAGEDLFPQVIGLEPARVGTMPKAAARLQRL